MVVNHSCYNNIQELNTGCQEGCCRLPGQQAERSAASPLLRELTKLGVKFEILPYSSPGFIPLEVNVGKAKNGLSWSEKRQVGHFIGYCSKLRDELVVVKSIADGKVAKVVRRADSSRYFLKGRQRIKAKLIKRMGGFYSVPGMMMSVTYDPKLISRDDAWHDVGVRGRRLEDNLNRWRKRAGMAKVRGIRLLEPQRGTGYPHLHFAYPKLKYLAPIGKLTAWWAQASNSVDLSYRDSFSPAGYVCKYVSKLDGWDDLSLSYIWSNRTRLYSMSRDFYLVPVEKRESEWAFNRTMSLSDFKVRFANLMNDFDTLLGVDELVNEFVKGVDDG